MSRAANFSAAAIKTLFLLILCLPFSENYTQEIGSVKAVDSSAKLDTTWNGFRRVAFKLDDRKCIVVMPDTAAEGNPWIWRTEFFGHEPQADIALLRKGYSAVYMDIHDMYGSPTAMTYMNEFYSYLVNESGLNRKTVLEGFSRGGLYAFNWAAENPDKVACIYVDAPVCDFKSWPAGKGNGEGSPNDWEKLKKIYGFTSDEEALGYAHNPVDNLEPIAEAGIPIISVCGGADKLVPMDENINIVKERYTKLGGHIEIIVKPECGHHPHSLEDPEPIVKFILENSNYK